MSADYTEEELKEFDRLTMRQSSPDQVTRIEARLDMSNFVAKHGKEKCNDMFAALEERDNAKQ